MKPYKGNWLTLESEDDIFMHVIPETDIRPHSVESEGNERVLATANCPCNPKILAEGKPIIVHNSFEDIDYLNALGL